MPRRPRRKPTEKSLHSFASRLLDWFAENGRHDLPWQAEVNPYRVWVSEIMLQQTQVATVIPYFLAFIERFPDVPTLAAATTDDVLSLWSGLGYYARGRNLHRAAQIVMSRHGGELPESIDTLVALPGIGRSTAAAILALSGDQRHAILDGNVKRVLARFHAVRGWPGETAVARLLWQHADEHTPEASVAEYTQAIMDLGATVCTRGRPRCEACPLAGDCLAWRDGLTGELPTPRKLKARPARSVTLLVVSDTDGATLLERRPASGIWGGLLSFPELQEETEPDEWCRRWLGSAPAAMQPLASVAHSFTHFDLTLNPVRLTLGRRETMVMDDDRWLWYKPDEPLPGGIASPIGKILRELTQLESPH